MYDRRFRECDGKKALISFFQNPVDNRLPEFYIRLKLTDYSVEDIAQMAHDRDVLCLFEVEEEADF